MSHFIKTNKYIIGLKPITKLKNYQFVVLFTCENYLLFVVQTITRPYQTIDPLQTIHMLKARI